MYSHVLLCITIYYIRTEKYSPKSYVVNFRTQTSSSQSEERTMVFTREKIDTSNQNRERCFFTCEKNISEMEWNCFVCFTVDKQNGKEPAKQQRKGINRTRRKLLLCFLSELLCLSFKLKLILKPAILLKFTHFQLCIENKQFRLLILLGLPHILTVIYVFNKHFY